MNKWVKAKQNAKKASQKKKDQMSTLASPSRRLTLGGKKLE